MEVDVIICNRKYYGMNWW